MLCKARRMYVKIFLCSGQQTSLSKLSSLVARRHRRKVCCSWLAQHLEFDCPLHRDPLDCADAVIFRDGSGQIGLPIHDGGSSYIRIRHCPWCGTRLRKQPADESPAPDHQHVRVVTGHVHDADAARRVLTRVAYWIGDDFNESSWATLVSGIEGEDTEEDREFKYTFDGWFEVTAFVADTREAGGLRVRLVGEIDDILATRMETLIEVLG